MILKEISRGITHIEDLPVSEFARVLGSLGQYEITEKVDGAQILFGMDGTGFYTSRETKGGARVYNESDYGVSFSTSYMRSAHRLLESCQDELRDAGMRSGDQVEAEVLYGQLPNVVPYSADRNYLIFLRTTEGQVNINKLKKQLDSKVVSVSLPCPITEDGRTIRIVEKDSVWEFARSPIIRIAVTNTNEKLNKLIRYLGTRDGHTEQTFDTILETPLNKIPEWCDRSSWQYTKEYLRERKAEIQLHVDSQFIMPIKERMLSQLVRATASKFGPALEEGGWIEGVVLRHKTTGRMVKIVDKDKFGTVREAAWAYRNELAESAKSPDGRLSFMAKLRVDMATSIGHPELGTIQAKAYLRKIDTITEDRASAVSRTFDFQAVRPYWANLLETQIDLLEGRLTSYIASAPRHTVSEKAFYSRNLETFAGTFKKLSEDVDLVKKSTNSKDLLLILVGKQLSELT
jgi:hypothetical protein